MKVEEKITLSHIYTGGPGGGGGAVVTQREVFGHSRFVNAGVFDIVRVLSFETID